ncbi:MAG: NADPH-dependent FMN reductase [Microbacterium sp.]
MPKLMIVIGSVREGRIGLPIAEWARTVAEQHGGFEIDWADLKKIALPMMDEPSHPRLREYTHPWTIEWSERVHAADAFLFVQPEYNYSYSPALKNALDYLSQEWWRKPIGTVSYGGISGGTRGVTAIRVPQIALGMVPTSANVEIAWAAKQVADGAFTPTEQQTAMIGRMLDELIELDGALSPLRAAHRR